MPRRTCCPGRRLMSHSRPNSSDRPPVIYVTWEGIARSSVFYSQVVEPFCTIALERESTLCVFERADLWWRYRKTSAEVAEHIRNRCGARTVVLPRLIGGIGLLAARLLLWAVARRYAGRDLQFHARGHMAGLVAAAVARLLRRSRVVLDVRGVVPEEVAYAKAAARACASRANPELEERRERCALSAADAVLTVSQTLADYLVDGHSIRRDSIVVCPCGTSAAFTFDSQCRGLVREQLGVTDARVGLYLGSASAWQMTKWVIDLFDLMAECWPGLTGLIVLADPDSLPREQHDEIRLRPYIRLLAVAHEDVPGLLAASDVGVLLREDSIVNRVASPVKMAESVCVGLPMLVTESVDQAVQYVRISGAGDVLPVGVLEGMRSSEAAREAVRSILADLRVLTDSERRELSAMWGTRLHWSVLAERVECAYRLSWETDR